MPHFRVTVLPCGRREIEQITEKPSLDPEIARRAVEAGLAPDHPVVAWLAARCLLAEGSVVGATQLYEDFAQWSGNRAEELPSQTAFGRALSRLGLPPGKSGWRGRVERRGVRLRG